MIEVRWRTNHWIAKLFKVSAITLYPYIFVYASEISPRLRRHELCHVEQIRRVGIFRFYVSYLMFYYAHRLAGKNSYIAYLAIPWEEEARARETL